MEAQVMLLRESTPAAELAARAVSSVMEGEVDPITAHINISRMEAAIKLFKENTDVRDITLRELAKYGKSHQFGDCRLEEAEVRLWCSVPRNPLPTRLQICRSPKMWMTCLFRRQWKNCCIWKSGKI